MKKINKKSADSNFLYHAVGLAISGIRDISPYELAEKIGASSSLIKMVEAGYSPFPISSLLGFIKLYPDVSFDRFSILYTAGKTFESYENASRNSALDLLILCEPSLEPIILHYLNNIGSNPELIRDKEWRKELREITKTYLCTSGNRLVGLAPFIIEHKETLVALKKLAETLKFI